MNGLKLLKSALRPTYVTQVRSSSWYLSRRRGRVEILDENYKPEGKQTRMHLKEKQLELMKNDRRVAIPWQTSAKYLESDEFKKAYRGLKVWIPYRRNVKGRIEETPHQTRNRCIVDGFVVAGSPCPVCRDKYLVIHPKNVELLKQFINPATDQVYPIRKIMLCEYTYEDLLAAVEIARDQGDLQFRVPFRLFAYEDFYSKELLKHLHTDDHYVEPNAIIERASRILNPTNYPYTPTAVPL